MGRPKMEGRRADGVRLSVVHLLAATDRHRGGAVVGRTARARELKPRDASTLVAGGRTAGMDTTTFCERLDERLHTDAYADLDASANGLQVAGPDDIDHAAFAVDAAVATAEHAAEAGADALCVHHGLFWGDVERATGPLHD